MRYRPFRAPTCPSDSDPQPVHQLLGPKPHGANKHHTLYKSFAHSSELEPPPEGAFSDNGRTTHFPSPRPPPPETSPQSHSAAFHRPRESHSGLGNSNRNINISNPGFTFRTTSWRRNRATLSLSLLTVSLPRCTTVKGFRATHRDNKRSG